MYQHTHIQSYIQRGVVVFFKISAKYFTKHYMHKWAYIKAHNIYVYTYVYLHMYVY